MKAAFLKQGLSSTFATWESHQYSSPEKLLDAFQFKSKLFSLLVELQADIWVVTGGEKVWGVFGSDFGELIIKKHKRVPVQDVPWDNYDIVISVLPIVPEKIIQAHPDILWCYCSISHTSDLHNKSLGKVQGGYDLFLDHASIRRKLKGLPQSISFPFPTNYELLRNLIRPTNGARVFLDTRLTKKEPLGWFEGRCDLSIRHSPRPADSGKRILAGEFAKTRTYLEALGSCKYFLLSRKLNFIGQATLEAAALGLIVVSGPGVYPNVLCHPKCLTEPNNPRQGLNRIKQVEKAKDLQTEILKYQDKALQDVFWERPLALLYKALEMKRKQK